MRAESRCPLPIMQENNFKVDPSDLRKLLSSKTKLLIINNPANPTGGFMNAAEITEIASIIRDTHTYVLSDEIYDRLVYSDDKPLSIASIPGMQERTIVLDGLSKTYSMTGWRVGYGLMNRDLARGMSTLMTNSCGCTAAFTQKSGNCSLNRTAGHGCANEGVLPYSRELSGECT